MFVVVAVLGVAGYVGMFTGHTQALFSRTNPNDKLVEMTATLLRDFPDDWSLSFGSVTHPSGLQVRLGSAAFLTTLKVDGREIQLTSRQKLKLCEAGQVIMTGGSDERLASRDAEIAARVIVSMAKHMNTP